MEKTKPNARKAHIHQSKEMYYNTIDHVSELVKITQYVVLYRATQLC